MVIDFPNATVVPVADFVGLLKSVSQATALQNLEVNVPALDKYDGVAEALLAV